MEIDACWIYQYQYSREETFLRDILVITKVSLENLEYRFLCHGKNKIFQCILRKLTTWADELVGVARVDLVIGIALQGSSFSMCSHSVDI